MILTNTTFALMTSTLLKLDDYLSAQVIGYLDAESLLAAEQSISQWRPKIADRWKVLDERMASVSVAQSRADTPQKRVWRFQHCAETAAIHARTRFQTFEQCPVRRDWDDYCWRLDCEIFLRFGRQEDQSVIWQGFVEPLNPWRDMQPWRPSPTLDSDVLLDAAREREILDRWPELKAYRDLEEWDEDYQCLASIMRNITLTIVRINRVGTFLEYSGTGLKVRDLHYNYWAPYPEEEPWSQQQLVRFGMDRVRAFIQFGLWGPLNPDSVWVLGEESSEDEWVQEEPYII